MKHKIEILFEDEAIVIVRKPANFLSIPARFKTEAPNLQTILKEKYGAIFVVHRLDKATSGIMCFARTEAAHKHLNDQFQNRKVKKLYLALVDGILAKKEGIINKPITESQAQRGKMLIHKRGKESITHYRVLEEFERYSLVEADIKTGRTHQVRVHFQAIGHPLVIDNLYGKREAFFLSEIKGKKYKTRKMQEERPLMSRSTLHAFQLQITHPTTDEPLIFETPLTKDFKAILTQFRKWTR